MGYEDVTVSIHICVKCIRTKENTCPFKPHERRGIVNCTSYEHKDNERNKRRWSKYE